MRQLRLLEQLLFGVHLAPHRDAAFTDGLAERVEQLPAALTRCPDIFLTTSPAMPWR